MKNLSDLIQKAVEAVGKEGKDEMKPSDTRNVVETSIALARRDEAGVWRPKPSSYGYIPKWEQGPLSLPKQAGTIPSALKA